MSTRDDMVLEVQVWLNATYGEEIIEAMGSPIEENGKTSWEVTNGLLIGLQVELGVPTPAPSFGPTTEAYLDAYGPISEGNNDDNANINQIIQGGCYATGYNPYGFNGIFDEYLSAAIMELEMNIGITATGIVDTKLMKALLTMNAYVLLAGGSTGVREFQQWLNGTYKNKEAFDYIPCDGLYSRTTQEGIVYGIQYECDLDDVANGSFGPTTKANLKEKGQVYVGDDDSVKGNYFVHLFTGAFLCNNVESNITFDGVYDDLLSEGVREFQTFTAVTIDGQGNYETWCELLVSTGDETRSTTALDCSVEKVTEERAKLFKESGYKYIGRYIIEIDGGLDKALEQYEIDNIFDNNMSIIPIFQMGGSYSDYFTSDMGEEDAEIAFDKARHTYGIPKRTTIYFAVDYDAYEYEAYAGIKDYFQAINEVFGKYSNYYHVGIYASRNICQIIYNEELVNNSYVSGMSTGYSGNLGYSLPTNWVFNQIAEDYDLGIDRVVANDKDTGFNKQLFTTEDINENLWLSMEKIYNLAMEYHPLGGTNLWNKYVMDYYRVEKYSGIVWAGIDGSIETGFLDYLEANGISPYDVNINNLDPERDAELDFSHLIATCEGYYLNGISKKTEPNRGDFGGWCGDFVSLFANYYNSDYTSINDYMSENCLADDFETPIETTSFGLVDYVSDIDACLIAAKLIENEELTIYEALRDYYNNDYNTRYNDFLSTRLEEVSEDNLIELNYNSIYPKANIIVAEYISGLFGATCGLDIENISDEDKLEFAELYTAKQLSIRK